MPVAVRARALVISGPRTSISTIGASGHTTAVVRATVVPAPVAGRSVAVAGAVGAAAVAAGAVGAATVEAGPIGVAAVVAASSASGVRGATTVDVAAGPIAVPRSVATGTSTAGAHVVPCGAAPVGIVVAAAPDRRAAARATRRARGTATVVGTTGSTVIAASPRSGGTGAAQVVPARSPVRVAGSTIVPPTLRAHAGAALAIVPRPVTAGPLTTSGESTAGGLPAGAPAGRVTAPGPGCPILRRASLGVGLDTRTTIVGSATITAGASVDPTTTVRRPAAGGTGRAGVSRLTGSTLGKGSERAVGRTPTTLTTVAESRSITPIIAANGVPVLATALSGTVRSVPPCRATPIRWARRGIARPTRPDPTRPGTITTGTITTGTIIATAVGCPTRPGCPTGTCRSVFAVPGAAAISSSRAVIAGTIRDTHDHDDTKK